MIARMWHGRVPASKADEYGRYVMRTGLRESAETPGNLGVMLLKREEESITHIYTLTFWNDMADVKKFAGPDPARARYFQKDVSFLLELEIEVMHCEVVESRGIFPGSHQ